ncbi:MAG: putative PAS/PAC sensor [Geobacteraceae bacterium]|nr:MAG: putative PAS/PAC sensor [Geobacteraceae bacterium]
MNVKWKARGPVGVRKAAVRITAIYAVIGGLWILFSDKLLSLLVTDPTLLSRMQTAKGWLYVGATALLLYWLLRRYLAEAERAARARGESEARFQAIYQTAPVSIWEADLSLVKADLDTLKAKGIKDFSQYFTDQPGYVMQVLQNLQVLDVNETTLKIFAAGSKTELLSALDRVFMQESLTVFRDGLVAIAEGKGYFEAEAVMITLQGDRRDILVSLAIPPDSTKFGNLPVSVVDITERKRTEEMLRLLESAVQQTREAITITTAELDPPGPQIVYVNPAFTAITGYEAREVIGKTPRILQGPKTDRKLLDRMRETLWQRRPFQCETVNYRKDGSEFIMEWYVAPLVNKQFQVTHFVAMQRDFTERKRAEEEIRNLNVELQRRITELEAAREIGGR